MAVMDAPNLLVILGPTASGKSAVAMQLAQRIGGEILAVDSMTLYREMDIGTAKPSATDRMLIPHHGIDLVEPGEQFTVAQFVEMADAVIADARARKTPLVATGGTPLYYKALFEGLFEGPPANPELRAHLQTQNGAALHARLSQVDPVAALRIHVNDTKRLIRALEVFELTGQPISSVQQQWAGGQRRHEAFFVGLLWDKEALNRRINARVKAMLEAGWVEEVRRLLERPGGLSKTAAEATGYAELTEYLMGRIKLDEAVERIKIATRQLARKQMKWFRRFADVRWLEGDRPADQIVPQIIELLEQSRP